MSALASSSSLVAKIREVSITVLTLAALSKDSSMPKTNSRSFTVPASMVSPFPLASPTAYRISPSSGSVANRPSSSHTNSDIPVLTNCPRMVALFPVVEQEEIGRYCSGDTRAVISSTASSGASTPVPICHRVTGISAPLGVLASRACPFLVKIQFGIDIDQPS